MAATISVNEALNLFPAPSFRKLQKETLVKMVEAFQSGIRCILLDAPTGSGKSYLNSTFCRYYKSFYATPQLSLIDQMKSDKHLLLNRVFTEMKGRQNYYCEYDPQYTVNIGMCKRRKDFPCDKMRVCPYWVQKQKALKAKSVLMSFAYFILEGGTDTPFSFGNRPLLILDESHSIDKYVLDHVNLEISPYTLPKKFYDGISPYIQEFKSKDNVDAFISAAVEFAKAEAQSYEQVTLDGKTLTVGDVIEKIKLEEFIQKAALYFGTENAEWVWQTTYTTLKDVGIRRRFIAQPLYATLFAPSMLWTRADLYIVSSATLINPKLFVRETGLDRAVSKDEILYLHVGSTFPPANRPIIDSSVGKMSLDKQAENLPKAVKKIEEILETEKENVAIHCHSYELANYVQKHINPKYKERVIFHTTEDRGEMLEQWKRSRGKVFISVGFEEGQNWKEEICRAQILLKTPYPDLEDKRVAKRLEKREWTWFRFEALKKAIQSYGRAVRSETDRANFYVLDEAFFDLVNWCYRWVPQWFKDALPDSRNKEKIAALKAEVKQLQKEVKKLGVTTTVAT